MDLGELIDILTVRAVAPGPGPAGAAAAAAAAPAPVPASAAGGAGSGIAAANGSASFVGNSPAGRTRTVFGGQFLAQALLAAGATVEAGRSPHSLHAYFVRAGDPLIPIDYHVEVVRDGRSFSHRHVVAAQDGKEVFRQLVSFQVTRPGPAHDEVDAVDEVDPEQLTPYLDWALTGTDNPDHDVYTDPGPLDVRYQAPPPPGPDRVVRGNQHLWARLGGTVPSDDPVVHAALLAWISDKTIADFATLAHGRRWTDHGTDSVSLDHAMWFHRPARADSWLRFSQEAPCSANGRAFTRGEFVTRAGARAATVTQEVLLTLPD